MTIEEKAGQLSQQFMFAPNANFENQIRGGQIGSLLFVTDPAVINRMQRIAVEETRLKVPLLFGYDVIHGFRTIFPVPLAMAASFDPASAERAQAVAAAEARSVGIHWTFAPMLDIARDPRWGRIVEGAGEDPYLGAAMGAAQVRGFQGSHLGAEGHIIAGPKHFLGYGAPDGGRDYDGVYLSDAEIYNTYLPPFRAAIQAGAGNVMSAYMDLNDIPASGNSWLLNDLLRGELGFQGWVVSDANAVKSQEVQDFAASRSDTAVRAVSAGNDMEMSIGRGAFAELAAAVRDGRLSEATLNQSVRRILIAKIRMGLFERPYVDEADAARVLASPQHRQEAEHAAAQSLVLLRNEGGVLPLTAGAQQRVAVIGPLADAPNDTLGPWAFKFDLEETVSVFEGVRDRLGSRATVETAPGVDLQRRFASPFAAIRPSAKPWEAGRAEAEFDRAVAMARQADVVIMALGESQEMSGEKASRSDLTLPGDQRRLLDAILQTGKPVVLVLQNGRPLDLTGIVDRVPAILEAWYPGTRGGAAVAAALFGDANPGGKLPVTWPRSVGQVPIYYGHNTTQAPNDQDERYWDEPSTPLYEFGYGLSYTSFDISEPTVAGEVGPSSAATVSVTVRNTGERAGDEVVQLYVHQRSGRASRPVRELKGFERVSLRPGETRTVRFSLDEAAVRYWNAGTRSWVIDPGVFDVWVGSSSAAQGHAEFTVAGQPR
ncbi:glycoside hydrolase [Brevundimonas sp. Leaf363]|nr:glycoside hydrolase [Brevundimonas sp. Leaf363]